MQAPEPPKMSIAVELHRLALAKHQPIVDALIKQCREAATTGALFIVVDKLENGVVVSMKGHGLAITEKWDFKGNGLSIMQHKISW